MPETPPFPSLMAAESSNEKGDGGILPGRHCRNRIARAGKYLRPLFRLARRGPARSGLRRPCERREEAARRAFEAAVGHEHHVVAVARLTEQRREQVVDARGGAPAPVERRDDRARVPGKFRAFEEVDAVGVAKARREFVRM